MLHEWAITLQHHEGNVSFLEPDAPSNVGVTTVTMNSLTVTWTASSTTGVSYTVTLKKKDGTEVKSEADVSETTKAIDGLTLTAGTPYTVVVVAVIGGQSSAEADKTFYTSKSGWNDIS